MGPETRDTSPPSSPGRTILATACRLDGTYSSVESLHWADWHGRAWGLANWAGLGWAGRLAACWLMSKYGGTERAAGRLSDWQHW